ncbi:NlpC/P60 family protein [Siccibacter colletis]|uniref:C40 family peptidase n=1 Tax=Siccibacter colletis TaxID=1505757 RepID=A0ABY6JER4_9ENTR|nr:NlpC/P60 family protein [Siccibacter colletis]UYU32132.1 C40 family peptidase [Siccibacter colletis]
MFKIIISALLGFAFISSASAFEIPKEIKHGGFFNQSARSYYIPQESLADGSIKSRILEQYNNWKGTRYHFGGTTRRGIDCSALMQHIFSDSINLSLPRTTGEQIHRGKSVSQQQLKPGDLVFFNTGPDHRHVGVYIGGDEFIHASSSKGVTISMLSNRYWQHHYITARRVADRRIS